MAAQLICGGPASAPARQQAVPDPHASKYPAHGGGVGWQTLPVHTSPSQHPASAELEQSPPLATQQSGGVPVVPEVVVPLVPVVVVVDEPVVPELLVPVVVVVVPVVPVVVPVDVVEAPVVPLDVVPPSRTGGLLEHAARAEPNAAVAKGNFQER
jgi:hypothetical protein